MCICVMKDGLFLLSIGLFVIDYPKLDLRDACKSDGIVAVTCKIFAEGTGWKGTFALYKTLGLN